MDKVSYQTSLWLDRWNTLDQLAINSNNKVAGYHNDENLNVCTTNVILGMIMSSKILIDIIQCKHKCCEETFNEEMEHVRNYIRGRILRLPQFDICGSDVLMMGISSTYNNHTYKSPYGVVGDYCITKVLRKHNRSISFDQNEPYDLLKKEQVIFIESHLRFHVLLRDLFRLNYTKYNSLYLNYFYYDSINLLNVEVNSESMEYDMFEPKPFSYSYVREIGEDMMDHVAKKLFSHKILPNIVHFSIEEKPNVRIHPYTFSLLVKLIEEANRKGTLERSPPNFPIFCYRVLFTVPKISRGKQIIPFKIGNKEEFYELKALSIRLKKEVQINTNDIPKIYNYKPELLDCTAKFMEKSKEAAKNKTAEIRKVVSSYIGDNIVLFRSICNVLLEGKTVYDMAVEIRGMHTFSLSLVNDTWLLMNDMNSFKILDIETFTEMLSDESVDGILLEKVEKSFQWDNYKHASSEGDSHSLESEYEETTSFIINPNTLHKFHRP